MESNEASVVARQDLHSTYVAMFHNIIHISSIYKVQRTIILTFSEMLQRGPKYTIIYFRGNFSGVYSVLCTRDEVFV